jgi:hypothetical protein
LVGGAPHRIAFHVSAAANVDVRRITRLCSDRPGGAVVGDACLCWRQRYSDNGITGTLVERLMAKIVSLRSLHGDGHAPVRVVAVRVGGDSCMMLPWN